MQSSGMVVTPPSVAMVGGGGAIVVGSFLPWLSINFLGTALTVNVLDIAKNQSVVQLTANPIFALVAGVVAVVAAVAYLVMASACWAAWIVAIASVAALIVAGLLVVDLQRASSAGFDPLSFLGIGYWISLVGAIVAIAGTVVALRSVPATTSS